MIDTNRLEAANKILKTYSQSYQLIIKNNRVAVQWYSSWQKKTVSKTWIKMSSNDLWPRWQYHCGGTQINSIAQLVRWVKGLPVYGIDVWYCWYRIGLGSEKTLKELVAAGYPLGSNCVLCKKDIINKGVDWWSLDKVVGPCCMFGKCE